MASSQTKPGTPRLSELARKVVAPDGIVSTGWPQVETTCRKRLGISFDPWQHGAGRLILAKRADGKLAVMIGGVGMSLPRQVGKTYLIGAMVFALCIDRPGMLIIWSAHHARTHGETFLAMQAFADRSKVKPYVEQVFKGSGDEEIRFRNGSRILFGARERGFGRGIPGVDMIVSDEAQIMSDKALDAQLATMNTSGFGLAIYIGTPPRPDDPSEAFTRMRDEAWKGTLRDAAWIEFGAEHGVDPTDRSVWKVNPSFPKRTPVESILRLQRKLTPESFLREGLGVWDEPTKGHSGITRAMWDAIGDPASVIEGVPVMAVDVSPDRKSAIAFAGFRPVPRRGVHVEVPFFAEGTDWVVDRCVEVRARWNITTPVHLDPAGPVGALLPGFAAAGIPVELLTMRDMAHGCGAFFNAVVDGDLYHLGSDDFLNLAVMGAERRPLGDAWAWTRRKSEVDIAPLVSATIAVRAANVASGDVSLSVW